MLSVFVQPAPARAEEEPGPVDRTLVVSAWQLGGGQVRAAAAAALLGTDAQVREFLTGGLQLAQKGDERDTLAGVIGEGGPAVRAAAQQALAAADAGDQDAISEFLSSGWQGPADIDTRLTVNQLMTVGGPQVQDAAQDALDSEDPAVMEKFLDSGWQVQWQTDQRLRVNQAISTGGPQVRAAGQKALDAGTPEAMEAFLAYGWAVASARDDEVATLTEVLAQAQAAGELAAQETQQATQEADRAKQAADAAKRAAAEAAAATEAARNDAEEAAAHARRAAVAADKAAQAAKVAVQAAAAASRAARAASTAASRAAAAAAKAGQAAARAYKAAADAATDAGKAAAARAAAQEANSIASQAREFAAKAEQAGKAIQAGMDAVNAAKSAAQNALAAAAANEDAVRHANAAGANAAEAVAAAQRARANAERALRAAQAAENYLRIAIDAAFAARDAARRAAANADAAAVAAVFAADHAGDAAEAASRATEHANAATAAAQDAVNAASQAVAVFEAAREADAERLAVVRDQGLEAAQAANVQYEAQKRQADWDVEQATKRSAETNQLLAVAQNSATPPAEAVTAARKVALALAEGPGGWTQQAALAALGDDDVRVLEFARTGVAAAAVQDDRHAVMNLAVTDNAALATAAKTALAGNDTQVRTFLRTQNYTGRYAQERLKVNQILAAANAAGDVVLAQAAQAALNAETLQALRDFLDSGQYTAAATGERVRVNQAAAAGGPEIKASAQIALDGPPTALREFLSTGQYFAAERDYEGAAHLAVVGGLLEKINQIAETAVQNSLLAHEVAARARNDAAAAAGYAQQAVASAEQAALYAAKAQAYAVEAAQSVDKAAAAVNTARAAAVRANNSARNAVRSASWAIASHRVAIEAATEAHASAKRAYDSAIAAGQDAEAAIAAAEQAFNTYKQAQGLEIAKCHTEYVAGPASDLEKLLGGSPGEFYRNCVRNVIADPGELATRAYTNAALCAIYPDGSQLYQNCIHSTLDPAFRGMQPLIFFAEVVKGLTATLIPVGATAAVLCIATVVCGAVAGTLLTIADVGINVFKLINGDQSLAQTLLKLGQVALETLLLAGVGKVLSAGFKALKAVYVTMRNAKKAQIELQTLTVIKLVVLGPAACLTRPNAAPAAMTYGSRVTTTGLATGSARTAVANNVVYTASAASTPPNSADCRLVLGIHQPGEDLATFLRGYTYNDPALRVVEIGTVNGVPQAKWMSAVNEALRSNSKIAVALDGFDNMNAGTVADAKAAYIEAYRLGKIAFLGGEWKATPWEMFRIGFFSRRGYLDWGNVDWYFGTTKIDLPEPRWFKDKDGEWWPQYQHENGEWWPEHV
ncbi:ALF repeat-containing protein [Catellatospora sichuanensis]|uniref:ALF repeat-containing protein n=1 Tax=Catellatospora sichuanensis TaxID=1969805 RepID=UPI0011823125|nr:ALF repeat-containing protein [Catellatospora sichuanensis]